MRFTTMMLAITTTASLLSGLTAHAEVVPGGGADTGDAAPFADAGPLRINGRWFVDEHGRKILLHGVNNVDKTAPYIQPGDGFTITAADAELLARHGFNTVRLGVSFDGLMPARGDIDESYLDRVVRVVNTLGDAGIHVLLDNHQDGLSEIWGGNGSPGCRWADDPRGTSTSTRAETILARMPARPGRRVRFRAAELDHGGRSRLMTLGHVRTVGVQRGRHPARSEAGPRRAQPASGTEASKDRKPSASRRSAGRRVRSCNT